jgi:hypothetical protein
MQTAFEDGVLQIIYKEISDIPSYIISIADVYEGVIKNRIGFNFPFEFVKKYNKSFVSKISDLSNKKDIKYIIVYKKGDILTKKHEMCHARYSMDIEYKKNVMKLWTSFTEKYRRGVIDLLKKMNYPDNTDILLDEFQAYYFTEKKGFFGKI